MRLAGEFTRPSGSFDGRRVILARSSVSLVHGLHCSSGAAGHRVCLRMGTGMMLRNSWGEFLLLEGQGAFIFLREKKKIQEGEAC